MNGHKHCSGVMVVMLGVLLAGGTAWAQPDREGADRRDEDNRGANEGQPPPTTSTTSAPPDAVQPPASRDKDHKPPRIRKPKGPTRYSRARALGIYHKAHVMVGLVQGDVATEQSGGMFTVESKTAFMAELDLGFLGLPSMYGNFHGIETFMGIVTTPFDLYWGFGLPLTFLNVGSGGPGSFRLGGSFGVGLAYKHAFAYVRGRAAAVIVPEKVDVEASLRWIPDSADGMYSGDDDFNDTNLRISAFYHPGGKKGRAWEVFLQMWERQRRDTGERSTRSDGEVKATVLGVGMTFM